MEKAHVDLTGVALGLLESTKEMDSNQMMHFSKIIKSLISNKNAGISRCFACTCTCLWLEALNRNWSAICCYSGIPGFSTLVYLT